MVNMFILALLNKSRSCRDEERQSKDAGKGNSVTRLLIAQDFPLVARILKLVLLEPTRKILTSVLRHSESCLTNLDILP